VSAQRYFGEWNEYADVVTLPGRYDYETEQYTDWVRPGWFPSDDEIVWASYDDENYCGRATIVFERDGRLVRADDTTDSYSGLSFEVPPEDTTWLALLMWAEANMDTRPGCAELRALASSRLAASERLTPADRRLIESALVPREGRPPARQHVLAEGADLETWRSLAARGLAQEIASPVAEADGVRVFVVTDAGVEMVKRGET
jgi:hypothetical protein